MTATSGAIRIGIVGYGNLGRGVQAALARQKDMMLAGVFTRRDPAKVALRDADVPVHRMEDLPGLAGKLDVLILCGGSKQDLPEQTPQLAKLFNTVDSFDTHARIPEYFETVDAAAQAGGHVALISIGWDPGVFSLNRLMGEAILPQGRTYTFWGKGISQGHSDAIRRVPGVRAGVQYTLPIGEAVEQVRRGAQPTLSPRESHRRECFVVLHDDADAEAVKQAIVTMPDYFADYDTTVHFISMETLQRDHAAMPHGGFVIRSGLTGASDPARPEDAQLIEYAIQLGSNPGFTASVLVAYARAAHRLHQAGHRGARTIYDVPPGLLSPDSPAELRRRLL